MNLMKLLARDTGILPELKHLDDFPSRRALLFGGSALGALWASAARGCPTPTSPARWYVNRLTMGLTTEELTRADDAPCGLGTQGFLEYHLNHLAIDDSAMDTRLAAYTTLTMQPYQLIPLSAGQVVNELIEAMILRAVFSKRQLFERMVEFWTDHFNIDINNGNDRWLKTVDDRDVIRANALGTFPALLSASARSPAMLYYLNNDISTAGNPNENYARELMELHTLSVNGGYTQNDVHEVARCFTGWTIWPQNYATQELRWTFRYNSAIHDNASKVVLGTTIPANGGMNDGLTVLNILANHPSTATFIATKLCKRFWGETPPRWLISAVTATYNATGGNIQEMLRTLFNNSDPLTAPLKYKRPYHQFIAALRSTAATITSTSGIRTQLTAAGQLPFNWGPPDGYADTLDAWVGLILPRWNFGASLLNSNVSGASINIDTLLPGATTADTVVNQIDTLMFGGAMPAADKNRIRTYLLPDPPTSTRKREAVGLAIGSPGYQWY